jgi:hypothetical protein
MRSQDINEFINVGFEMVNTVSPKIYLHKVIGKIFKKQHTP